MNFLVSGKAVYKYNTVTEIIIVLMNLTRKGFPKCKVIDILSPHIVLFYSTFVCISGSQVMLIYHVHDM